MNTPLISIIIPVYNVEAYLDNCISSILAQTYTNWELLLLDDGSTDNSKVICDNYADRDNRIKVFHKPNTGVSNTRNLGIANAKGDYVTFVDSDDFIESSTLQMYIDAIRKHKVDIVKVGYFHEFVNERTDIVSLPEDKICQTPYEMFKTLERAHYYSFIWNMCIRRSVIDNVRFNEKINWLEDHLFSYQCYFNCKRMAVLSKPCYHYMIRKRKTLTNVENPEVLYLASEMELEWKKKLVGANDEALLQEIIQGYKYQMHHLVTILYENDFPYKERKIYSEKGRILKDLVYKEERIFFSKVLPFGIRNLLLSILFILRKYKNRNDV